MILHFGRQEVGCDQIGRVITPTDIWTIALFYETHCGPQYNLPYPSGSHVNEYRIF